MAPRRISSLLFVACTVALVPLATAHSAAAPWHPRFARSVPAANDTLSASPPTISLWFSEAIEPAVSRVRLEGPNGVRIAVGAVSGIRGEGPSAVAVALRGPAGAGTYTVRWTVAGADGHPMKGAYSFVIAPRR